MQENNPSKELDEVKSLIEQLLHLKCIFLFEQEIEEVKHKGLLNNLKRYTKEAKTIDLNRILLTIVKNFTECYFNDVKDRFEAVMERLKLELSDEFTEDGTKILKKCLIILEKRMFENLYNTLNEQPLYFLMILNIYNIDYTKINENYVINEEGEVSLVEGLQKYGINYKNINIFELIKFVYYNAVINAKKEISRRIFKKFLKENLIKEFVYDRDKEDPCEELISMRGKTDKSQKSRENNDQKLKIAEYLIKNLWNHLPDLKLPILLQNEAISNQISALIDDFVEEDCNNIDEERTENINWNYVVSIDGETLYLNAPTYKLIDNFTMIMSRAPQEDDQVTFEDFSKKIKAKNKGVKMSKFNKCAKPGDIFEKELDNILRNRESLVGEKLVPDKYVPTTNERLLSYVKIRNKTKKKLAMKKKLWEEFQKTYFTFEDNKEDEENKVGCNYPVRPQEFFDLIPNVILKTVRPIEHEFINSRYICAACGLFIEHGTGVSAMGYKWHDEHFRCKVCCEKFTTPQNFILYRGIVLCEYDADIILGSN